ncbi:MAG: hypothetical protein HY914_17900 [Desulfomonile tiedjei]|nr:hypothetical protein [Desulfomonile tiedjei]
MSTGSRASSVALLIVVFLVCVLAYVEYRSLHPEWKLFQERGIALAVQRLEQKLSEAGPQNERQDLLDQIAALKKKVPEIIEIKPFGGRLPPERCLTCHEGIEDLSASHPNSVFGCVMCHGGNGPDLTVAGAHRGLRGGKNPARLDLAEVSCGSSKAVVGSCHSERAHPLLNRVENVPRALMATNAGIIGTLRFQWGLSEDSTSPYAIRSVSDGRTTLHSIPAESGLGGDADYAASHFRKFCAACHLWSPRHREKMGRQEGCPACHAPYNEGGLYRGGDPTIKRDEPGHATSHTITNRIPDEQCRNCHNRSARTGLNYHGQMESSQDGTPLVQGGENPETLSDDRFFWKLVPDVHHEKGMGCIDCHTGQDTMGDGTVYRHMKDQIEIRCEDCHGASGLPPRTMKASAHDPLVQTLMRSSPFLKLTEGDTILQTSKGRPLPHVRLTEKGFSLTSKLSGKEHPVRVITGKRDAHAIAGHGRLECDACHSAWSPQCYGCHQVLDFGHQGTDHVTGKNTDGRWAEGRGFFRFDRHIYGINSLGKVGILVPGCQVWNTVIDARGNVVGDYDSKIMQLKNGRSSIAMAPTHPHTTRTEVPRCIDCHLDPKALGLGDGRLTREAGSNKLHVEPIYDSASSGLNIPYPIDAVVDTEGTILQGTSHKLSRGFNREELAKIVGIAPCLPCHDRYTDPVWQKPGPYKQAPACLEALKKMEDAER